MKKLLVFLCVALLLVVPAAADQTVKTLKFSWSQTVSDLPNLAGWTLYWSDSTSGGWTVAATVPYTGGAGPGFEAENQLTVTGDPGAEVVKYFQLTATGKNGFESGPSNIVSYAFVIPWRDVTAPQSLTVEVIVRQQAAPAAQPRTPLRRIYEALKGVAPNAVP
jgi:hypothetical protein